MLCAPLRRAKATTERLEATGAQNFLDLDDISVCDEGEEIHAQSILSLPLANHRCMLPKFDRVPDDPFLRQVDASGMRWVIVTDPSGEPVFVLDAHHFCATRCSTSSNTI